MSTYGPDGRSAARRHYEDATRLETAKRYDNAGYLYGLATECGLKALLLDSNVRHDDPAIWSHFPALKDLAAQAVRTRASAKLLSLIEGVGLTEWHVSMRYAKTGAVSATRVQEWREKALRCLLALD